MEMTMAVSVACAAAALSGGAGAWTLGGVWQRRRARKRLLERATNGTMDAERPLCGGLAALYITQARLLSRSSEAAAPAWMQMGTDRLLSAAVPAGLRHAVNRDGLANARIRMTLLTCAVVACAGALLSPLLGAIGAFAGMTFGWTGMRRSLRAETLARRRTLERHLSQAIEVISLGLRSGLTFDRALDLYCSCFDTAFTRELSIAHGEWSSGLRTREEALRAVAESYDSKLLGRTVDGIIRSLRFGSPLADTLDALAGEAREGHKAAVQEQVMKAPVKMMVPVGTLILPSMLLLVLGPVLLDLLK